MIFFQKRFFDVFRPIYFVFIVIGVLIDLGSKYWVVQNYSYQNSECYFNEFFCMTLTFNTGFIFGINQNAFLISLFTTGIAIVFLIGYRWYHFDLGSPWGWNLVMVGAFGNFIDKFFLKMPPGGGIRMGINPIESGQYNGVVDFLDFDWPDFLIFHRWPAFNFADSCISVGLVILIITMHLDEKRKLLEMEKSKN